MKTYHFLSLFFFIVHIPVTDAQSYSSWNYIEVENNRDKWGDYDPKMEWLRYFGLDTEDINGDGYAEILAGRRLYLNPGDVMEDRWEISDFGMNVDGILLMNVDGDEYADVIAQALPNIYWLEVEDKNFTSWKATAIANVPATTHTNSQGFEKVRLFGNDKEEILIAGAGDIYSIIIPDEGAELGNWPTLKIGENSSDEGIGFGDIDDDGNIDVVAGRKAKGDAEPTIVVWWKNPGNQTGLWESSELGISNHAIDRVEVADLDGDRKLDVVISEERWPGKEPDGNLFWFKQPNNLSEKWDRRYVVTQYSMNNLDVRDMDGDGDIDLVTAEHKGPDLEVQIWNNDGKGVFSKEVIDAGKESHLGTQLYDMDSDGDLDIVSIGWDNYKLLHLWRNDKKAD